MWILIKYLHVGQLSYQLAHLVSIHELQRDWFIKFHFGVLLECLHRDDLQVEEPLEDVEVKANIHLN